jgi:uncharacterized membrane protein YgaE (UPF0421/DUF939 family)
MESKVFWQSKVFWTQLLGFLSATLVAVLPGEYNQIIMTGIALVTAILTMVFRWNTDVTIGWKK